jgi:hypothetical protein
MSLVEMLQDHTNVWIQAWRMFLDGIRYGVWRSQIK